ncbi:siderophore-interacting protein [Microbacterium sp. LRZ72]|uniref:siderophore-interacting protein n=1 Tax=Microbacterium sp. LRZ72 TaxID=2942481 RepID=UPI0029C0C264|nr:siderophore-interacting protein [Microbacterium sp. LRZ72]
MRRTYTVRSVDRDARTLAIDFVVHGDEGVAGPWAGAASAGDRLTFSGPGGQYAPSDEDVEYLFVGDESALPAIAAALEALPEAAYGRALIEVGGPDGQIPVTAPAGVEVTWLHRVGGDGAAAADYGVPLVEAVAALPRPTGPVDVFAHGEREAMKKLRGIFHEEWGMERRALSLSAYWARGGPRIAFRRRSGSRSARSSTREVTSTGAGVKGVVAVPRAT